MSRWIVPLHCLLFAALAACGDDVEPPSGDDDDDGPPVVDTDTGAPTDTGDTGQPTDTGDTDTGQPTDTGDTGAPIDTGPPPEGVPVVVRFEADPPGLGVDGGPVTLSWEVTDADTVRIDGIGEVTGDSVVVEVDETTLFTLTATNEEGATEESTLVITATPGPPAIDRSAFNSVHLIEEALATGEIDPVTALRYKVFALFGDPRLPERFELDAYVHGSQVMRELAFGWDQLPLDVQEELRPFRLPPTHPESWYQLDHPVPGARHGTVDSIIEVDVEEGVIFLWYNREHFSDSGVTFLRHTVGGAIQKSWKELTELMGAGEARKLPIQDSDFEGDDDVYHVYAILDPDNRSLGWADLADYDASAGGYPSSVVVNLYRVAQVISEDNSFPLADLTSATVAHELFHGIQNAFDTDVDNIGTDEQALLDESTATWSEHYVYPAFDTEQIYVESYLSRIESHLWDTIDNREYGAYLFPFYVTQELGPETIRRMYELGEGQETIEAMADAVEIESTVDGIGRDFHAYWQQYAEVAWNEPPVTSFREWDDMTRSVAEFTDTLNVFLAADETLPIELLADVPVGPPAPGVRALSSMYFHFDLSDSDARSIVFANGYSFALHRGAGSGTDPSFGTGWYAEPLGEEAREGAHVSAFVKRQGAWEEPIDLTDVPFTTFCQLYEEEEVEELVLIFANSRHEEGERTRIEPVDEPPLLFGSSTCGYAEASLTISGPTVNRSYALQFPNTFEPEPSYLLTVYPDDLDAGFEATLVQLSSPQANIEISWPSRSAGTWLRVPFETPEATVDVSFLDLDKDALGYPIAFGDLVPMRLEVDEYELEAIERFVSGSFEGTLSVEVGPGEDQDHSVTGTFEVRDLLE